MKQKIINDCKAVANVMIPIIIILILVIVGAVYVFSPETVGASSEYWETKNEFGMWGDEILVEFEDGSEKSLKILQENQALDVLYNGQKITKISRVVKAKATGSGFTSCEIHREDYKMRTQIIKNSNSQVMREWTTGFNYGDLTIQLDTWFKIFESNFDPNSNTYLGSYASGMYTIKFFSEGSVKYRGMPDGDWKSASLPGSAQIIVEVDEGEITLNLQSSISGS